MARWQVDSIEITGGGFLSGVSLKLPPGLTCVIGARGSGKTTLAEAFRYALAGEAKANKTRQALIAGNLGDAVINLCATTADGVGYLITRAGRGEPSLTTSDGKAVTAVELGRGTFLPLDAYTSDEIEDIADENLGEKRRALIDDLLGQELWSQLRTLQATKRDLDTNADDIRATHRLIAGLTEESEELREARARLAALPPVDTAVASTELVQLSRQQQCNRHEQRRLVEAQALLDDSSAALTKAVEALGSFEDNPAGLADSANADIVHQVDDVLHEAATIAKRALDDARVALANAKARMNSIANQINNAHSQQAADFAAAQQRNLAESAAIQRRNEAEQAVARFDTIHLEISDAQAKLKQLLEERKAIKGRFLTGREQVSTLRAAVAAKLEHEAGGKVRVRILRGADTSDYEQLLLTGVRGAGLRNHDDILLGLRMIRPEALAQLIQDNDSNGLEAELCLGAERSRKLMAAFRERIDPLDLEIVRIEDRVAIELNVSTSGEANFKDASELSKGQKCTALLPLLLARRDTPIVIDQPEDNLDNHFIFETVVETVRRIKQHRQMVFITHNANIPVLAEAERIIVLDSDGRRGFVRKMGNLDDCKDEIIDLLEGGREAFERRRKRYARS